VERAWLVHVFFSDSRYREHGDREDLARETRDLALSAGLEVVGEERIQRDLPAPDLYIGKGRAGDLAARLEAEQAQVVIFGNDLSVIQQRNLEELARTKVIDRTQLILDIFAQRARSSEGKAQVELAQLQYLLPRLTGRGTALSRLGGGIGTRGPGEQKLEIDRRRIRERMVRLRRTMETIRSRRALARGRREEGRLPVISLVGYTNAGKSTLLNALTKAGALSRDQLFTTLDPLTRRLELGQGQAILLTDTVGFLQRLPVHLVKAFESTLEEVRESAGLLHVVDGSSSMLEARMEAVGRIFEEMGIDPFRAMILFNKCDQLVQEERRVLLRRYAGALLISARTGEGINQVRDRLRGFLRLAGQVQRADFSLP
jgi:GTPase